MALTRTSTEALVKGRGRYRNIVRIEPANCAKNFMFKPLEETVYVFSNPSNDKYAWIGADKSKVIVLQDFHWSRKMISWKDLLLLLEGEAVKLPVLKNQYTGDIVINDYTPILTTRKERIRFEDKYNTYYQRETEMMSV